MLIRIRSRASLAAGRGASPAIAALFAIGCCVLPSLASAQAQVSALGRLEPWHGTLMITAAPTPESTGGTVLGSLFVDRGDNVKAGQLLAVTESAGLKKAQAEEARADVEYQRRLAIASRDAGTATCVQADVAALVSKRRQDLLARKLTSPEDAERAKADADAARASCQAARASASATEAGVAVAAARLKAASAALQRAYVKAPVAGRVLSVHARPGEMIGPQGIIELGRVDRMYAIAEVYETDIGRVRVGQRATVSSRALARPLSGTVERIRQQVRKQDQLGTDPAARKDARIVEVEIRLADSAPAASLTNLQVEVLIGSLPGR
jgi:HlyD family secretion protein